MNSQSIIRANNTKLITIQLCGQRSVIE